MSDLPARLRKWEADLKAYRLVNLGVATEAADEIERLEAIVKGLEECDAEDKAEIARLETLNLRLAKDAMTDRDEVARLRAALEEIRNWPERRPANRRVLRWRMALLDRTGQ